MDARSLGLILVWIGTILLVAVLQQRLRQGALGEEAFDQAPPIARWAVAIAVTGMGCALVGIALTVWSFL
jgi:hypothetical protein